MAPVKILIAGDLAPTQTNFTYFSSGNIEGIVDRKLMDIFSAADIRVFNLEVPLTDIDNPISKDGPTLKAPVQVIKGIKLLDPSVMTLANNHIMDHGEKGLLSTLELLAENSIKYLGAGRDLSEASRPLIIQEGGIKIGIYACAEHEFSIATDVSAGANPIDLLESFDHISTLKDECDYVIVLYHGGKEHYRYPTPGLQKICRKMVKKGASLVVCQHSHCIGAFEKYDDGMIVYGQGNFLFDRNDNVFWKTGILVNAILGEKMDVEFIPFTKKGNGVILSDPQTAQAILNDLLERSDQITRQEFVEKHFDQYCAENGQYYLATLAGLGKIFRRADKFLKRPFTRLIYSPAKLDIIRNHFDCETHREMIVRYIQLLTNRS